MRASAVFTVLLATLAPTATINAQAKGAKGKPVPDSSLFERGQLTGDWGGLRTAWKEKGFELESSVTQFVQGIASGGIRTSSEYNGVAQAELDFDLGKLVGWKNWLAEAKLDFRFGGPLLGGTGSINTVNTAVIIPAAEGTVLAVTALNVTRLIPIHEKKGDFFAVSVGRFNFVDVIDEELFAGAGVERFFNVAQVGPLTVLRQVPLVTNALSLAYIRGGEPFVSLAVLDPNDHSVDAGLTDFFADGVTFSPGINFPAKYWGKSAEHSIGGAITTKAYTPFDAIRQIILPGRSVRPIAQKRGSWSTFYTFRQYIVERDKDDGWGFFGQLSFADRATSPVTSFFDLGFGGNGLFNARHGDEFGIAYAYTDLSPVLKDNIELLSERGRLRAEHQLEVFYNLHITPWLQLTGDLQVIRPNRPIAETATVPGGRLRIVF